MNTYKTAHMKALKTISILLLILIIIAAVAGVLQYHSWRQGFVEPVRMSDTEEGVFESHPDNAMPDKKTKLPEGVL